MIRWQPLTVSARSLLLAFFLANVALGQNAPRRTLATIRSLKCEFPAAASFDWFNEKRVKVIKQDFGFHIDAIDVQKGTARLIGNNGSEDLTVIAGESVLHFIERTPSGSLNTTSVFEQPNGPGTSLNAVTSRHIAMLDGIPMTSQNYGVCRVWE